MADIKLYKKNNIHFYVDCEYEIETELAKWFSTKAKNYQFHPKYKMKAWDGTLYFYNRRNHELPIGFYALFVHFCKVKNYSVELCFDKSELRTEISTSEMLSLFNMVLDTNKFQLREYQIEAIENSIKKKRGIVRSATGSGKSIIIYVLVRYLLSKNRQIMITVPTVSLVDQLIGDFKDYGWLDCEQYVCKKYSGLEMDENKPILLTTWQSAYKKDEEFFIRFDSILMDECLHPDTIITMADGSLKRIEDVNIGDYVLSKNGDSIEKKMVTKKYRNIPTSFRKKLFSIELENGDIRFPDGITGNHTLYTKTGKKRVDELESGDELDGL